MPFNFVFSYRAFFKVFPNSSPPQKVSRYETSWSSAKYPSVVYFAKIKAGRYEQIIKMVIVSDNIHISELKYS